MANYGDLSLFMPRCNLIQGHKLQNLCFVLVCFACWLRVAQADANVATCRRQASECRIQQYTPLSFCCWFAGAALIYDNPLSHGLWPGKCISSSSSGSGTATSTGKCRSVFPRPCEMSAPRVPPDVRGR